MCSCPCPSHRPKVKPPATFLRWPFSIKKAEKIWAGCCRTQRRQFSEGSMGRCDRTGAWSGATEPEWWSHKCLPRFLRQESTSADAWSRHLSAFLTPYLNSLWPSTHFSQCRGCLLIRLPRSGCFRATRSTVRWPLTSWKKFYTALIRW